MIFTYLLSTLVAAKSTENTVFPFDCTIITKNGTPAKFHIDLKSGGQEKVQQQGHKIILAAKKNRYVKLTLNKESKRHRLSKKGFTIKVEEHGTTVQCTLPKK